MTKETARKLEALCEAAIIFGRTFDEHNRKPTRSGFDQLVRWKHSLAYAALRYAEAKSDETLARNLKRQ